ncbi:MAG: hypothetical protein ACRDRN_09570 [Sciscionella sp.]
MSLDTPAGPWDIGDAHPPAVGAAVSAAEQVLSRRFGARITLGEPEDLGGGGDATVVRVRVASSPYSLPRTLVVKRYPGGGNAGFAREAGSYQLFNALAEEDRVSAELYAHGGDEQVLVLEDLGAAPTLEDKLLGGDARAAEQALLGWARALGRLHATTAGREADFDALMRRQHHSADEQSMLSTAVDSARELPALLERTLGVRETAATSQFVERAAGLLSGGRHRAYSPADVCPDNNLIADVGARFLDFEGGCVREALLDVGYLLVPFPSCWCSFALPDGMSAAMLAVWRAEVVGAWPDLADDDQLDVQLLDARLFWVWLSTWWLLPRADEEDSPIDPAHPSPRRGVALAARWCELADEATRLDVGDVAGYSEATAAALDRRFGADLELFPAFR